MGLLCCGLGAYQKRAKNVNELVHYIPKGATKGVQTLEISFYSQVHRISKENHTRLNTQKLNFE